MSDTQLRKELIRLAHAKPEFRPHLLPLLRKKAGIRRAYTPGEDLSEKVLEKNFQEVGKFIERMNGNPYQIKRTRKGPKLKIKGYTDNNQPTFLTLSYDWDWMSLAVGVEDHRGRSKRGPELYDPEITFDELLTEMKDMYNKSGMYAEKVDW